MIIFHCQFTNYKDRKTCNTKRLSWLCVFICCLQRLNCCWLLSKPRQSAVGRYPDEPTTQLATSIANDRGVSKESHRKWHNYGVNDSWPVYDRTSSSSTWAVRGFTAPFDPIYIACQIMRPISSCILALTLPTLHNVTDSVHSFWQAYSWPWRWACRPCRWSPPSSYSIFITIVRPLRFRAGSRWFSSTTFRDSYVSRNTVRRATARRKPATTMWTTVTPATK